LLKISLQQNKSIIFGLRNEINYKEQPTPSKEAEKAKGLLYKKDSGSVLMNNGKIYSSPIESPQPTTEFN
jgi:hypothetical protein